MTHDPEPKLPDGISFNEKGYYYQIQGYGCFCSLDEIKKLRDLSAIYSAIVEHSDWRERLSKRPVVTEAMMSAANAVFSRTGTSFLDDLREAISAAIMAQEKPETERAVE